MVNTQINLKAASGLVAAYIVITIATILALGILSAVARDQATSEAWGHAVIVAAFSVVLALRMRAARRGSRRAVTAVTIIATVLAVVNLVEAVLPHTFPAWMRVEMVAVAVVAALLAAVTAGRLWPADRSTATR